MKNRMRESLERGEVSIGSWLNLASPLSAEIMASVGYEWLVVDAEHTALGVGEVAHSLRAIQSAGATPMARPWDHSPQTLARILDAGALGLVVPHVSTAAQAEAIAQACRYPPAGNRSVGMSRALSVWGADYLELVNQELMVLAQIEDRAGVDNSADILAVEGIDSGFLGPTDLARDLGVEPGSQTLEAAMETVLRSAQKVGKPCGTVATTGQNLRQRKAQGFQIFDLNSDSRFLETIARRELEASREGS